MRILSPLQTPYILRIFVKKYIRIPAIVKVQLLGSQAKFFL